MIGKHKYILILITTFVCSIFELFSQENNPVEFDMLLERLSQETNTSPNYEYLEQIHNNPISLHKARISDLIKIPTITFNIAESILNDVKENPKITFDDLQRYLNLSEDQVLILQYCTSLDFTENSYYKEQSSFSERTRSISNFNKIEGFEKDKFNGSALDLYSKATYSYENHSFGAMVNKNSGETSFFNTPRIYYSGDFSQIKYVAGDFTVATGLGSIFSEPFGPMKGYDVISPVLRQGSGIDPYCSTVDFSFFRGLAAQGIININKLNYLKAIAFVSKRPLSANIDTSHNFVSSIYTTGYFRTDNEEAKLNKLHENAVGANVEWDNPRFSIGANFLNLRYDYKIESDSKSAFDGKNGSLSSFYAIYHSPQFSLGTEISLDAKRNLGFVSGLLIERYSYDIALNVRSFSENFRSPYGYSFGEFYQPSNELGMYLGVKVKPQKSIEINMYADIFQTQGKTYTLNFEQSGIELFTQLDIKINAHSKIYLRTFFEDKTDGLTDSLKQKVSYEKTRMSFRVDFQHDISRKLELRIQSEVKYTSFDEIKPGEFGTAAFCQLDYKISDYLAVGNRLTLFSTASYETAIYNFESPVPGYMSNIPLYLTGLRDQIYTRLNWNNNVSLTASFFLTGKNNQSSLGSGLTTIYGNVERKLFLQLDIKF